MAGVGADDLYPQLRYVRNHPELCRERARAWYAANAERSKASAKAWKAANPERAKRYDKAYNEAWRAAHPKQVREQCRSRRALKALVIVERVDEWVVFRRDRWVCQICHHRVDKLLSSPHKMGPTLDHIIPLAKGGEHSYANTQLAHRSCNSAKGAKLLIPSLTISP